MTETTPLNLCNEAVIEGATLIKMLDDWQRVESGLKGELERPSFEDMEVHLWNLTRNLILLRASYTREYQIAAWKRHEQNEQNNPYHERLD